MREIRVFPQTIEERLSAVIPSHEGSRIEKKVADEKESNMDAGQSDFTDPPAIRQICYWILARYQ